MESEDYWIICWMQSIQWNLVISIKTRLSQAACRSGIKCGQPRRAARCRASSRPPLAIVISYFWNCEKLCDCMSWGSCRGEGRGQSVESSQPKPYQILFTIHMPPPLSGFTNGHFSVREEEAPHQLSDTRDEKMLGPSRVSPYSHIPQKAGMSLIFKEIPINYVFARRGF